MIGHKWAAMLNMTMLPDLDFRLWRILLFFPARRQSQSTDKDHQWPVVFIYGQSHEIDGCRALMAEFCLQPFVAGPLAKWKIRQIQIPYF